AMIAPPWAMADEKMWPRRVGTPRPGTSREDGKGNLRDHRNTGRSSVRRNFQSVGTVIRVGVYGMALSFVKYNGRKWARGTLFYLTFVTKQATEGDGGGLDAAW